MVRQRPKAAPGRDPAREVGAPQGTDGLSDAEILALRRRAGAFEQADDFLRVFSWCIWALAGMWFFAFSSSAPVAASALHASASDPVLTMICTGIFVGSLGKTPSKAWSGWRRAWHLAWCPALGLLALPFLRFGVARQAPAAAAQLPARANGLVVGGACAVLALLVFLTCPGAGPGRGTGKASAAVWGRMLLVLDGAFGLLLSATVLLRLPHLHAESLGLAAVFASVVPMSMWCVGTMLCESEAELLAAAPPMALFHAWASAAAWVQEGLLVAAPTMLFSVLHVALYCPLPPGNPDANPFHVTLRRFLRNFAQLMTQPVSGFGEEG